MCNEKKYIPFIKRNKEKSEFFYIKDALQQDLLEHGAKYTQLCEQWLKNYYHCDRAVVTTSGFSALYIIMLLEKIGKGDEVILSSYSCPSAMNSVLLVDGTPVLCGINKAGCLDVEKFEKIVNCNTRMVILNHYGGFACDMQPILDICKKHNIIVVEDCATAMGSKYRNHLLGTFGDYAIVSFNDKKDITSGEGGALIINKTSIVNNAYAYNNGIERIRLKQEGREVPTWCGMGYSNKLSDISAALLYAQLLATNSIIEKKQTLWKTYHDNLIRNAKEFEYELCRNKEYESTNGNTFYLKFRNTVIRDTVRNVLLEEGIETLAHYGTLRKCMYIDDRIKYSGDDDGSSFDSLILRLPIYTELEVEDIEYICEKVLYALEAIKNGKYSIDPKM